jgi:tRNA G37 N-methylase Trm5
MRENIEMNSVGDTVEVTDGDAMDIDVGCCFDTVVSAVPDTEQSLLPVCIEAVAGDGSILFYRFAENPEDLDLRGTSLEGYAKCGDRGPSSRRYRFELEPTQ